MEEVVSSAQWPQILAFLLVVGTIIGAFGWVWRRLIPFLRKVARFVDQLVGEPAQGRQPARPGLLERLDIMSEQLETVQGEQTRVSDQLKTNGGTTLRDGLNRVEANQKVDHEALGLMTAKVDALTRAIGAREVIQQVEKIAGHEEAAEMWKAVQAVQESTPHEE